QHRAVRAPARAATGSAAPRRACAGGSGVRPARRPAPRPRPRSRSPAARAPSRREGVAPRAGRVRTSPSEVHLTRRVRRGVDPGADPELLLDLLLDLVGEVGVVSQEAARVLLALAELVALVRVPGAGLADEAVLDAEVDETPLARDAHPVEDV